MSIPTKIDVPNVVVTFVSLNSLSKVDFDFWPEKVNRLTFDQKGNRLTFDQKGNRLTFDQKVNLDPFRDDSRSWLISTFQIQIYNPRRQILILTQIELPHHFM